MDSFFIHTAGAQRLGNRGIRSKKKKHKKRKEKQFGVGCLLLRRVGSSFWLPELGCHVEWGPRLAMLNWLQLICSLNAAFSRQFWNGTGFFIWFVFFPRKRDCKGRTQQVIVFYCSWFIPTNRKACMLAQTHTMHDSCFSIKSKAIYVVFINMYLFSVYTYNIYLFGN